jgi:ribonuclease-3
MTADQAELERAIGFRFTQVDLLVRALTHGSHRGESGIERKPGDDNEQLEFLGDAVLGLIVSEHVVRACPDFHEGPLTNVKARLVNRAHLADVARRLQLGKHLLMGKAEDSTGGRDKSSLLANALEALLAAVYLDGGLDAVRQLIVEHVVGDADIRTLAAEATNNVKMELEMIARTRRLARPEYATRLENSGYPQTFTAEVRIGKDLRASGHGRSKKIAELAAARELLSQLRQATG